MDKEIKSNGLTISDLSSTEQKVYERITDYLCEECPELQDEEGNFYWSKIGQLLINSSEY